MVTTSERRIGAVTEFLNRKRRDGRRVTNAAAARHFKMSPNTVAAIRAGKQRTDMAARTEENENSPKKKAMLARRALVQELVKKSLTLYGSARQISAELKRRRIKYVSESTINLDLHALGYKSLVRPKVTFCDKKVEDTRAVFANRSMFRTVAQRERIAFSDEHICDTNDRTHRRQWVRTRQQLRRRISMNRYNIPSIQVWGAVAIDWRSELVVIKFEKKDDKGTASNRMTADRYIEHCLTPVLDDLKKRNLLFQQDGAACHTAKIVKQFMATNNVPLLQGWPAHSPDLNMIEPIWAELNRRIAAMPRAKNVEELTAQAKRAWKQIPKEVMNAHVRHFGKALAKVRADTR